MRIEMFKYLPSLLVLFSTFAYYLFVYKDIDRAVFLDVGQGDAAIIQYQEVDIVIDGGPDDSVISKLGLYMPPWDRHIDLVVLTHPHLDHLAGLIDIVRRFDVDHVWINPVCYSSGEYGYFIDQIASIVSIVTDEEVYVLNGLKMEVLSPSKSLSYEGCAIGESGEFRSEQSNVNNDSIVLRVSTEDGSILFMGDAEKELEEQLIVKGREMNADILKAGHHCSSTSTTDDLLMLVEPAVVICSYGDNNMYGHPSEDLLMKFGELGISISATASQGDIVIKL